MVIRRIREHVAAHNWFAVGVDVVIVVAGVFIGTQANNWNEARIDRVSASESRDEIIEDLKSNQVGLASRRAYYGTARAHAMAALAALEHPDRPRRAQFLLDAYQATQTWQRPLVRTGFDEMAEAGLTRFIGDRKTRSRLTNYYTQMPQFETLASSVTTYRERLRRAMPYDVQMAVKRQCGETVTFTAGGAQLRALPNACRLDVDETAMAAALSRLQAADLVEDLTRHIADMDQKLAGIEAFAKQARELRLHLQSID